MSLFASDIAKINSQGEQEFKSFISSDFGQEYSKELRLLNADLRNHGMYNIVHFDGKSETDIAAVNNLIKQFELRFESEAPSGLEAPNGIFDPVTIFREISPFSSLSFPKS